MKRRDFIKATAAAPALTLVSDTGVRREPQPPIQPAPIHCEYVYARNASGYFTGIMRHWREGDVGRCHLCPLVACNARKYGQSWCSVGVPELVARADTDLFSMTDWLERRGLPVSSMG